MFKKFNINTTKNASKYVKYAVIGIIKLIPCMKPKRWERDVVSLIEEFITIVRVIAWRI